MATEDLREQLCNERKTGTFAEVQLPLERVTSLHGILIDLDPKLYLPDNTIFPPSDDPKIFHEKIRPVLDRHPLARHAEVRASGTGLHVIIRLDPPIEMTTEAEQRWWDAAVRIIQCTLPGDVNAPAITALTRAVGSVNSRKGRKVEVLHPGQPVNRKAVEDFLARVDKAPVKEVASILLGGDRVRPCPVCQTDGSGLNVLDYVCLCYGNCGKVKLEQIYDCVYAPLKQNSEKEADPKGAQTASGSVAERRKRPRIDSAASNKGKKGKRKNKSGAGGRASGKGKPD